LSNFIKNLRTIFLLLALITGIGTNILYAQSQETSVKTLSFTQNNNSDKPEIVLLQVIEDNNEDDETSHWENEIFTQTPNYQLSDSIRTNNSIGSHKNHLKRCIWRVFRNLRL